MKDFNALSFWSSQHALLTFQEHEIVEMLAQFEEDEQAMKTSKVRGVFLIPSWKWFSFVCSLLSFSFSVTKEKSDLGSRRYRIETIYVRPTISIVKELLPLVHNRVHPDKIYLYAIYFDFLLANFAMWSEKRMVYM